MDEKTKVTEDALSKAIDELIEQNFGEGLKKGNGQPENKIDELPKDTDVVANGGKDIIKSDDKDEDEAEKAKKKAADMKKAEDDKKAEEAKKCAMKKSEEEIEKAKKEKEDKEKLEKEYKKSEQEDGSEKLIKSLTEENTSLKKSFEDLQKSIDEKFENIGEIFKGLKYEIDTLKKSPAPRKSIKDVGEIKKSFAEAGAEEDEGKPESFKKSEVEGAIESLVKSGQISSSTMTEFEMYSRISNPHYSKLVAAEVLKNRKK